MAKRTKEVHLAKKRKNSQNMKNLRVLAFFKKSLIIRDSESNKSIWRINLNIYQNLLKKAKEEKTLSWEESVDLVQYLLDTEKLTEHPEFEKLCQYYITEGLCYYVPSWQLYNCQLLWTECFAIIAILIRCDPYHGIDLREHRENPPSESLFVPYFVGTG